MRGFAGAGILYASCGLVGVFAFGALTGCGRNGQLEGGMSGSSVSQSSREESQEVKVEEHRSGDWSPGLSEKERQTLLDIAEDTLAWCTGEPGSHFSFDSYEISGKLKEKLATFVTLDKEGMLRGCIGTLEPRDALFRSVHANTVSAARNDFRFPPVAPEEIPAIKLRVSILSPIEPIGSIEEFKLGEHGIILEKGRNRAVFLPEVATEQKWSTEETLSALSQKAGLSPDGWREGASFKVFSSVVLAP
jgi:hypothetical protein